MSNFSYLAQKPLFADFAPACVEAERSLTVSYSTAALQTRRALELAVKWVYSYDNDLSVPYQDNLSSLIYDYKFKNILDSKLFPRIQFIVGTGNKAAHTAKPVRRIDAIESLRSLYDFILWIVWSYSDEPHTERFSEALLPEGEATEAKDARMQQQLEKLQAELEAKDKKLAELLQKSEVRKKYRVIRVDNQNARPFKGEDISEFKTRKVYIDLALDLAGWTLGSSAREEVELAGMPSASGNGRADYVLYGKNGKPVAVVEAKRTSVDPKAGKIQAKLYADCLEKSSGQRPFIFYTNGFTTWFWDEGNYPERRVSGFFSPEELAWFIERGAEQKPLKGYAINEAITNRPYQKQAIQAVCDTLSAKHRKALLVMATGTGKTRTAISLVDVLMRQGWVKNVLFLADRRELVKQAKRNFTLLLPNLSQCNLLEGADSPESRMVFSTYPTMMNAIDETRSEDGSRLFSAGHFDLIIVDEAHRSIYKKYQDIFSYFDGFLVGLTATPKTEIDHNTYGLFELENDVPTYAYELSEAVDSGYLNAYRTVETKLKFLEEGISYDDLSEAEKDAWEDTFDEETGYDDYVPGAELNKFLFNANTVDTVLRQLMEKGIRVNGGDRLGKTIIFAANKKHADYILERHDALYPSSGGKIAESIHIGVKYIDSVIDRFSTKEKLPQIAISVDMLDTGIDIPELVNLVFFKKVRSKSKFNQMIGRGTRLCKDLFGVGEDKGDFLIFDYCGNFEYFRAEKKSIEPKTAKSLTEQLFLVRARLAKELQNLKYADAAHGADVAHGGTGYQSFRNSLAEVLHTAVRSIPQELFSSRLRIEFIRKYETRAVWDGISDGMLFELEEKIASIVPCGEGNGLGDELAKRFDLLMYSIMLSCLQGTYNKTQSQRLVRTGEALAKIGSNEKVLKQAAVINRVLEPEYWNEADIFEHESVRVALRDLIDLIDYENKGIYYTNFIDEVMAIVEGEPIYGGEGDFRSYQLKVRSYLRDHQDDLSVHKLRHNQDLSAVDVRHLEDILWKELGSKDDYASEFKDEPLVKLVARLVGLDGSAAQALFSEFLSDNSLDSNQMNFVQMVVQHVVENGFLDKAALNDPPFNNYGDLASLFDGKIDTIQGIVKRIDKLNARLVVA